MIPAPLVGRVVVDTSADRRNPFLLLAAGCHINITFAVDAIGFGNDGSYCNPSFATPDASFNLLSRARFRARPPGVCHSLKGRPAFTYFIQRHRQEWWE
jgi:hypothetical protein